MRPIFTARRTSLTLFLATASALSLAGVSRAEDPQTPEELRAEAAQLEAIARENLASEIPHLRPTALKFREMALSYRDEAAWREAAADLQRQADLAEKADEKKKAALLRNESVQKLADAVAAQTERERTMRERAQKDDLRFELRMLVDKARNLREEGAFENAAEVEAEVQEKLRLYGLDPRFERAASLRKRALDARFVGEFDDAEMYDREADRMLAEATGNARAAGSNAGGGPVSAAETERDELRSEVEALRAEFQALRAAVDGLREDPRAKDAVSSSATKR